VVEDGKLDWGRMSGMTDMILPVTGEMAMVAGVRRRVSSGRVMTAREETRTVRGSSLRGKVLGTVIVMVVKGSVGELMEENMREVEGNKEEKKQERPEEKENVTRI
jgi:hypothetical protein